MTPKIKQVLVTLTLLILIVGLAAVGFVAARSDQLPVLDRSGLAVALLIGLPLFLAAALILAGRYLAQQNPALSANHSRYLEAGLVTTFLTATVIEVWVAILLINPDAVGRGGVVRAIIAFMGVSLAVRGNFMAKADPPTGEGAPDPLAWSRTMRRFGWSLVGIGGLLLICALAVPLRQTVIVLLATAPVLTMIVLKQRRDQRRSGT